MQCINFSKDLHLGAYVIDDDNTEMEILSIQQLSNGELRVILLETKNYPPVYEVEPSYALHTVFV